MVRMSTLAADISEVDLRLAHSAIRSQQIAAYAAKSCCMCFLSHLGSLDFRHSPFPYKEHDKMHLLLW